MNVERLLKSVGLNRNEAKVYGFLLKTEPSLIINISRNTELQRPVVYKALATLQEKNLIASVEKGRRKFYAAESPKKISDMFELLKSDFEKTLPELEETHLKVRGKPMVKYYTGPRGIRAVLNDLVDTLPNNGVYYRYSSHQSAIKIEKYVPKNLRERRDKKGLQRYMITDALTDEQKKIHINRSHKILPGSSGLFDYEINQLIYENKIAFIDLNTETAAIIENPAIAAFQKRIFKILYNKI